MVVHVQVQPLYDLEHDRGRLQYEQLVVYVCGGLEESEVPERFDIGGQRLPLGVLLDEQRGRAGVDRGGLQQVEECQAQGDQQREYEPFPFGQAKVEQVLDLNGIVHRFGGGRILGHFHMVRLLLFFVLGVLLFGYLTKRTVTVVISETSDIQKVAESTLLPFTVDWRARIEFGSTYTTSSCCR